jgi:hypothetical protein
MMRIQSNAEDLHPNVVFERMDDDTPNSIKRLKDFHEKYMVLSKKQKIGWGWNIGFSIFEHRFQTLLHMVNLWLCYS